MKTQSSLLVLSLALVCLALGACAASGPHRLTGQVLDDTSISARTKTALLADSTTDGLGGYVDSNAERDAAVTAAQRVKGAQKVINNLAVR